MASPLSSTNYRYLELYFYSSHDMSFAWSVMYYSALCFVCFLVCHNHLLLDTPFERDTHLFVIFYNTLCASLISFELGSCSSASLIYFRAWWWLYFKEIFALSCFTYIILRVDNSNANMYKL